MAVFHRRLLLATASAALAAAVAPAVAAAARCPGHALRATTITHTLAAGHAVSISNRFVTGTVRIPAEVRAPVTLHRVTFCGPFVASSTSFDKLVDLRGSRFRAGADFTDATFNGPAVFTGIRTWSGSALRVDFATFRGLAFFGGTIIRGPATFADTEFDGPTRFRGGRFGRTARFDSASFGDTADFSAMRFAQNADFGAAEFRSVASFSGTYFDQRSTFVATRFSDFADFSATTFGGQSGKPVSFRAAGFDAGANFLESEFDGTTSFVLIQSGGDLIFDGTDFETTLLFTQARVVGDMTFSRASFRGFVNFDEADVHKLDLDGAVFIGDAATVLLPQPNASTAHLDELRFDPGDVRHIGIGQGRIPDTQRETALALVEAAALRGGDARAANQAQYLRRTLIRHNRPLVARIFDWLVMWQIGGYLVRPWHQVAAIIALLIAATTIRVFDPRLHGQARAPVKGSFGTSFAAFWRLRIHEGTGWDQFEATAYKLVVVVLVLNVANVWPTGHDLLKGVLP